MEIKHFSASESTQDEQQDQSILSLKQVDQSKSNGQSGESQAFDSVDWLKPSYLQRNPEKQLQTTSSLGQNTDSIINQAENHNQRQIQAEERIILHRKNDNKNDIQQRDKNIPKEAEEVIPKYILEKLYPHQIQGVKWLYNNYQNNIGCILADDMGLGKTVQISILLGILFNQKLLRQALIVAPATLLDYWYGEIIRWTPEQNMNIQYLNQDLKRRIQVIQVNQKNRTVYLVSPQSLIKHVDHFEQYGKLDLMVIDEGHKAKNIYTQLRKTLKAIYVRKQKVILSGTPVQNNLNEFYSLIDIVQDGILGEYKQFQSDFSKVIDRGLKKNAQFRYLMRAQEKIQELKDVYKPLFLRRTKKEIFQIKSSELSDEPLLPNELPIKTDLVIWIPLNDVQKKIYSLILQEDSVKRVAKQQSKKHIFIIILALKHLCVHPLILLHTFFKDQEAIEDDELDQQVMTIDEDAESIDDRSEATDVIRDDDQKLSLAEKLGLRYIKKQIEDTFDFKDYKKWIRQSNKIKFLFELLNELYSSGHKVLIFSKSKILLNLVENILKYETLYKFLRLDGDVPIPNRDKICQNFNNDPQIFCFLLTNQVSGVGLNLVSADRAVIIDPDWNPANDNQSIDRCYRIGQKRDVIVYRLISTCSVEEKIYRRQVYKSGLSKATLEDTSGNLMKYFDEQDLVELLKYDENDQKCYTLDLINEKHDFQIVETPTNVTHVKFLQQNEIVDGVTDNQILFSREEDQEEPEDQETLIAKRFQQFNGGWSNNASKNRNNMLSGISNRYSFPFQ
ncbi:dna excision repair protein ercc-6-like [Stylonychia lemnae]|uniref:Dna excision repair protein ercc-6-like n=1 Tax=Stylonychia lemnae TaxID=5949 RepID=A0A078ASP1_STYLE|nr:dna excision repair protein ercc-6-like [Stylonychia lemnae]|eukprot:CDW85194.1 dna excision repair protein ercc-6-like [Stylonychia lemnae]